MVYEGAFADVCRWDSAYAQLQWACSIIGAILVTINPAYKMHELVNKHLVKQATILNTVFIARNAKTCRSFALVPGPEYSNVEIFKFVGRSMPRGRQLNEGLYSGGSITAPKGWRKNEWPLSSPVDM